MSVGTAAGRFIHTNFLAPQKVKRNPGDARKRSLFITSVGFGIMLCLFVFLWVRIYIVEIGYNVSHVLKKQEMLLQENRKLRLERARLCCPSRIEDIARNSLGMVSPKNDQIVIVRW